MDRPNTDGGEILKTSRCIHFGFSMFVWLVLFFLLSRCSLSLAGAAKYHFRGEKYLCLSRQNTSFVATKLLVETKPLSGQTYFCRNKLFVAASVRVCRDKMILVTAPANDSPRYAVIAEYNIPVLVYVIFN